MVLALAATGCGRSGPDDARPVQVSVALDQAAATPGRSLTLVWRFEMAPDWHLYWIGRNDSGFAPTVTLDLPAGWIAGGLQWPAPQRHLAAGDILDHVFYRELVLLQQVGVPADAPTTGAAELAARVEWLACKDSCVPGKAALTIEVPLAAHVSGPSSAATLAAREALPRPLPAGLLTTRWDGQVFHISGPEGAQLQFMPTVDCGELVNLIRDGVGPNLALRFKPEEGTVGPVRGLITVEKPGAPPRAFIADFPAALLSETLSGG